jgi:hypothetical protein
LLLPACHWPVLQVLNGLIVILRGRGLPHGLSGSHEVLVKGDLRVLTAQSGLWTRVKMHYVRVRSRRRTSKEGPTKIQRCGGASREIEVAR